MINIIRAWLDPQQNYTKKKYERICGFIYLFIEINIFYFKLLYKLQNVPPVVAYICMGRRQEGQLSEEPNE